MNMWKVSLGGKLFLFHFVAISTVVLLLFRGHDFLGPDWLAPFSQDHLSWLFMLLSLPIFLPAAIPKIDGGCGDLTLLEKFLLQFIFLGWMTANSLLVGYGTAAICKRIAIRKQKRKQN